MGTIYLLQSGGVLAEIYLYEIQLLVIWWLDWIIVADVYISAEISRYILWAYWGYIIWDYWGWLFLLSTNVNHLMTIIPTVHIWMLLFQQFLYLLYWVVGLVINLWNWLYPHVCSCNLCGDMRNFLSSFYRVRIYPILVSQRAGIVLWVMEVTQWL